MTPRYREFLDVCKALEAPATTTAPELRRLRQLWEDWSLWSKTSARDCDGWESDFPEWNALIGEACRVMVMQPIPDGGFQLVEACWLISEECWEMLEWAMENPRYCVPALEQLLDSRHHSVRWQVYLAFSALGERGVEYLRRGLQDADEYCRRRAALELVKHCPPDHAELAALIVNDADEYTRAAAEELRVCKRIT